MTQIERIKYYEKLLDRLTLAETEFDNALENFRAAHEAVRELDGYGGSDDWRQDFADDEAGKLPQDLKRGVLSEDAAFDALTEYRRLLSEMLHFAADVI